MHVLVTADTVGGVWIYTRELVSELSRRGVTVTLVSFGEIPNAAQTEWLDGLRRINFHPTGFRLEWMQDAKQDIADSRDYLMSVIEETRPDLLHLSQFCYGTLPAGIPKLVVAHSDVVSWWESVNGVTPPEDDWMRWYRRTVADGLRAATVVAAPTRWMLCEVERLYGVRGRNSVIHNGRSPGLFNPYCEKQDIVLSVGRVWDAGKQVNLLTESELPVPICIVGDEQHADESLRQDSERHGVKGVEFRGRQSERQLASLYGHAGIYAATSRYEPFGLAPLEAAFSRCAVVANDIPTFRELWGNAACYFSRNDATSLAETIGRLRQDSGLRLAYANLAYNRARQRFTACRMVDEYMALYRSMLATGAAAA